MQVVGQRQLHFSVSTPAFLEQETRAHAYTVDIERTCSTPERRRQTAIESRVRVSGRKRRSISTQRGLGYLPSFKLNTSDLASIHPPDSIDSPAHTHTSPPTLAGTSAPHGPKQRRLRPRSHIPFGQLFHRKSKS